MKIDSRKIHDCHASNQARATACQESTKWSLKAFGDLPLTKEKGLAGLPIVDGGFYYTIIGGYVKLWVSIDDNKPDLEFNTMNGDHFVIDTETGILNFVEPFTPEEMAKALSETTIVKEPTKSLPTQGQLSEPKLPPPEYENVAENETVREIKPDEVNAENLEEFLRQQIRKGD